MLRTVLKRLNLFARCRRGLAAVEFALILPIMLPMLYGMVEIGNVYLLDRKVTRASMVGADLVAQAETITTAELGDVMDAMDQIIMPFASGSRSIVVTAVWHDPVDDRAEVDWSVARNATPDTAGNAYTTLPGNLITTGQSVIVVTYVYNYTPSLAHFVGSLTITDHSYLRPRLSLRVEKT